MFVPNYLPPHTVEFCIGPDVDEDRRRWIERVCLLVESMEQTVEVRFLDYFETAHMHEYSGVIVFMEDSTFAEDLALAEDISELLISGLNKCSVGLLSKVKIFICFKNDLSYGHVEAFALMYNVNPGHILHREGSITYSFPRCAPNIFGRRHLT